MVMLAEVPSNSYLDFVKLMEKIMIPASCYARMSATGHAGKS